MWPAKLKLLYISVGIIAKLRLISSSLLEMVTNPYEKKQTLIKYDNQQTKRKQRINTFTLEKNVLYSTIETREKSVSLFTKLNKTFLVYLQKLVYNIKQHLIIDLPYLMTQPTNSTS